MLKQILLSAIAMASLQAAPIGDQANIYAEVYRALHKYKEVDLTFVGPIQVIKKETRKFREEDHGMLKPRSLELWGVPVLSREILMSPFPGEFEANPIPLKQTLQLTFNVEVLDFPALGNTPAHSEFVNIFNVKLYEVRRSGARAMRSVITLKDKEQPEWSKRELTLMSRKLVKMEKERGKPFTAAEKLIQEEIVKKTLFTGKSAPSQRDPRTLEDAKIFIVRKKK
jgi:hypothetical protein